MMKLSKRYRPPPLVGDEKPSIAIHLPIYNERYVIERLLTACTRLADHYGKQKVHISVLDDSDDETTEIVERAAASHRTNGYTVDVLHRNNRSGYKAGALNSALSQTSEEFLVVFDSDFIPASDFLDRAVSYITADERIGIVQFRWSYTNQDYNWVTKSVSIGMDAYFLIEKPGRYAAGYFHNFNGSGGMIRAEALREAGGWQVDTLAEDLDASYRIQMHQYRIIYVLDDVPCEITPTVASFKRQQGRWARGSLQVAKKTLPQLFLRKDLNLVQKFEAAIHLTYYFVHPLMYLSFLLACLAAILNVSSIQTAAVTPQQIDVSSFPPLWVAFAIPIMLCTTAILVYYAVAVRLQERSLLRNWKYLFILCLLGYGISVSNSFEAAKAFFLKKSGMFKRTPKYAVSFGEESWRSRKYQVPLDWTSVIEGSSILLAIFAISRAIYFNNYGILPILAVYTGAFSFVFFATISQSGKEKLSVTGHL